MILDEESNSYFCETCNIIYSEEELNKPENVKIFLLCFFMWVPIVNLILLGVYKDKSKEENTIYTNVAVASLFFQCIVGIGIVLFLYINNTTSITKFMVEARRIGENNIYVSSIAERLPVIPDFEIVEPGEYVPEEVKNVYEEEVLHILDNSIITGDKVKELIYKYDEYGYLLQTTSIRTKYTSMNYYVNVGKLFRECEYDEVIDYANVSASLEDTFTLNKRKDVGLAHIDDKTRTSCIYESERFLVNVLHDKDGECVGLAFTELEE